MYPDSGMDRRFLALRPLIDTTEVIRTCFTTPIDFCGINTGDRTSVLSQSKGDLIRLIDSHEPYRSMQKTPLQ